MRSELVTQAAEPVRNRFLLVHVTSTITRKFHRPSKDRLPDTINNSLAGLAEGKYLCCPGVAISNIVPNGFDAAPIWAIRAGILDLDAYNGITGEAQCSYVKPENLPALNEALAMAETA
jgi:hypothetical protein